MKEIPSWQAINGVFTNETGLLNTRQVIDLVYAKFPDKPWKEITIGQNLIYLSVNHPSGIHNLSVRQHAFLFWVPRGRFRKHDPDKDGIWEVRSGRVYLVDSDEGEIAEEGEIEEAALDTSLSLERDLGDSIIGNLGQLEPGLRLYKEGDLAGRELNTGVGRIDILAVDPNGVLVVVELKAGRVDDRVCGQILRYIVWVKETLAGSRIVRGIVVANEFSESLKYAARAMPDVVLKKYDVRFTFTDVS